MRETPEQLMHRIQNALSGDLRKGRWRSHTSSPVSGHCYVASEALFHALGGFESEWRPYFLKTNGEPHWFLKNKGTGEILDPTSQQFMWNLDYNKAKGKGFLTRYPSRRAKEVLRRIGYEEPVSEGLVESLLNTI